MTPFSEYIQCPVTIGGERVVLIPDLVGPVPVAEQHQYVELVPATNTCPSISVRETDIEDVRERYPELPIFGLWQVLVESDVFSFRQPLHVVKINDLDGYYLACDLGRAEFSGVYEAGFFAADANFDLDDANEVNPDINQLNLPKVQAKLAAELRAERRVKTQRSWRNLAIACVWSCILAFGVDFVLGSYYSQEQQELQQKTAMLKTLQSGLNQLKTSRLTEVPNNIEAIKKLAAIWGTFPNIRSIGALSLSKREFQFRLTDEGFDPKEKLGWLTTTYKPEGFWVVSFSNPNT